MTQEGSREALATLRRLRHDMRTSVGHIKGYSEMLQEEAEDRGVPELIGDLKKIHGSAGRLLDLVDQMLQPEDAPSDEAESSLGRDADEGPDQPPTEEIAPPTEAASGSVLVVDDDANNRDLLTRRLTRAGYRVTGAEDGEKALEHVGENAFDLVLLDVMMPGIDGFEVLRRIRQSYSMSDLPVIMATSLTEADQVLSAFDLGANDFVSKPFEMAVVLARVSTHVKIRRTVRKVEQLAQQLQIRNAFIRKTFGRYVSDEIATDLLENPESFEAKGGRRNVSILLADLRGFSTLVESVAPVDVLRLLNNYLAAMTEVIQSHGGTIDEFIGDAVLAFFGAPKSRGEDAKQAVTCALDMQRAIDGVNSRNLEMGLSAVELGIGIATGPVIVGTIGSDRRSKYGAVGSAVNLAARIESYTLGGEILVCSETLEQAGPGVRVSEMREVRPKGFDDPIPIHCVVGIEGRDDLSLVAATSRFVELATEIPVLIAGIEGKDVSSHSFGGYILALSANSALLSSDEPVETMSDLRLQLLDPAGFAIEGAFYGKVVAGVQKPGDAFEVRITARSDALTELIRSSLGSTV